jgi:cell division GTPase FtsZ
LTAIQRWFFITAGMGSGTNGCCASNCNLQKRDILTGRDCNSTFCSKEKCVKKQAIIGIKNYAKQVDSTVINNNKLKKYTEILVSLDFQKRMKFGSLKRQLKLITHHTQNIDLKDTNHVK